VRFGKGRGLVQDHREALFGRLSAAYAARDFAAIEGSLRPDVILHIPGSSPFAGEHPGEENVARLLVGLRQFLDPGGQPVAYTHEGDVMIASQTVSVSGPKHRVDMELKVMIRFDGDDRVEAAYLQPSDVGLFDHVISTALLNSALEP
jgi:hypothetical protein